MEWPEAERFPEEIGSRPRKELLRVLDSPADARADLVRQFFHGRGGGEMAVLLILLEERGMDTSSDGGGTAAPRNSEVTAVQAGLWGNGCSTSPRRRGARRSVSLGLDDLEADLA